MQLGGPSLVSTPLGERGKSAVITASAASGGQQTFTRNQVCSPDAISGFPGQDLFDPTQQSLVLGRVDLLAAA